MSIKPKDLVLGKDNDPVNYPQGTFPQITDQETNLVSVPKEFFDDWLGFDSALLAAGS